MTTNKFLRPVVSACAVAALTGLTGCATLPWDNSEQVAAAEQSARYNEEQFRNIKARMDGIEQQIQQLQADNTALKTTQGSSVSVARDAVSDMDRRLRAVEAARERDKQEIVDNLSKKVTQIVSTATPPPPTYSPSRSKYGKPSSARESGFEHAVKSGDTLAAIAAAYGVTVDDIRKANNLTTKTQIRVGQKLFIPDKGKKQ